jgi:phosphoglycolate phosphatase-like HAD superfamily hydrolase
VNQPTFAVFDIDGVLADVTHRLHHLQSRPKRWDAFFAAAAADPVLEPGRRRALEAAREHALVYVSGRPERLRGATQQWLDDHGLPSGALVLRRDRDHRPARVLKPELLRQVARSGRVVLVVDDDAQVCQALREAGYPVEQATWAPPPPALTEAQEREGRT